MPAPPACNFAGVYPPNSTSVDVTWYRAWFDAVGGPTYTDNVTTLYLETLLKNIANSGGTVIGITFKDSAGNPITAGLDACGNPLPPPPPPGGGGGGGGSGPPDAGDDEFTVSFGELMLALQTLINLIQKLTTSQPQPINYTSCCHAIVVALEALVKTVAKLEVTLSAPGAVPPPPIDLTAVVTELTCVCTNLTSISQSSATVANDLAPGLKSIAAAVANAPSTDLSGVVEQLKAIVREGDVKQAILDSLTRDGFLSGADAQVLAGADWGDAIVRIFRTAGWNALTWALKTVGLNWDGVKFVANDLSNSIAEIVSAVVRTALDLGAAPLYPEVKGIIDGVVSALQPTAPPTIGTVQVCPDLLLAKTLSPILIMNGVMLLASYFGWDVSEQLREYVDIAAEFVGLQEVRELKVGQMMKYGPMREAEIRAKGTFRQELPGYGALAGWSARGLLPESRYRNLTGAVGLPTELIDPSIEGAFSGLNARMLLRLAGTGLFTDADVADELTFGGMRPASQHRLIAAAAFLGTEPERHKFLSAVERVYAAGLISDNNFIAAIDSAAHNTDRHDLSLRTVQLEKQIALAKEYEAAYSHEFLNGLLDAPGYQSALEALGMQQPDVAARMFRDESHLLVTQTLGAERAARAEAKKTAAEARKAAIEGFRTGTIDSTALTAALNLAGLTPAQTAAEVAYQLLASSGTLRWIYGRHLSPQEATLLRHQVQDLTRQREIQMLTDAQYVSQLQALSIPPRVIQALRAGANAHISPKTQAILTPPVTP